LYKPFSPVRNLKKGFIGEGSSPRYTGRTFKAFVDFFICFLRLEASLDAFRYFRNFFGGSVKHLFFLQCIILSTRKFPESIDPRLAIQKCSSSVDCRIYLFFSSEIEDKHARRDRYTSGPLTDFKEKEHYRPDVKLEYVDETGRRMNEKEAFRFLSHRFHGKGSGKKKTEKRAKKLAEEDVTNLNKEINKNKFISFVFR
jgi:hypothetical protein